MLIEIVTFRLASGVDETAFLEADQRAQTEFFCLQPGLMRRTTARGSDGQWAVIVLWGSEGHADAAAARSETDPVATAFTSLVDRSTYSVARYTTLD